MGRFGGKPALAPAGVLGLALLVAPGLARAAEPGWDPRVDHPFAVAEEVRTAPSFFMIGVGYASGGFGPGLLARVGTRFTNGLSLSGSLTYLPGESITERVDTVPVTVIAFHGTGLLGGPELGYDFSTGPFVFRPYVAAGFAGTWTRSVATPGLAVWGGLQAFYFLPDFGQFFAVELRGLGATTQLGGAPACFGAFLNYGMTFGGSEISSFTR